MSWRDQLRQASFRSVECLYEAADREGGRRLVVHEYPQRDEPDIEDLGRRPRRFRLDLYLLASQLGDAYWPQRDRLTEALEAEGPGTLVHPYYGAVEVHVESFSERYSTREGGMVRYACTFVAATAPRQPRRSLVTQDALLGAADDVDAAVRDRFLERWSTARLPEFVRDAADRVVDAAREALGLPTSVAVAINDAASVVDELQGARAELATLGLPRIRRLRGFGDDLDDVPRSTPSKRQQADNQDAVVDVVRATVLTAAAEAAASTVFDSVDEAMAVRADLLAEIDDQALTADDPTFEALRALRAALVEDTGARGAGLPNVLTITPTEIEPALVIAQRMYGDARRAEDIVTRNNIRHPGFVPGGQTLEVLSDAAP